MLGRPRRRGPFPGMHSPFRRKGVWRHLPSHGPWRIEVRNGVPEIRDDLGRDPLHDATGIERLHNRWLAAWAPEAFEALLLVVQRLHSLNSGWERDDELVQWAVGVLFGAKPHAADEERCGIHGDARRRAEVQLEIDLHRRLPAKGTGDQDDDVA